MSSTFHVQLFPTTFPSANIDLEAEKRSFHRRRSTRKLEGARGTTPPFLNLDSKTGLMTNSPTSPRTRAVRRKGHLFNSPSSPISSSESLGSAREQSDDSDHQLHSPSSSRSQSPLTAGDPVSNGNNSNRAISARVKTGNKAKTTKAEGPQHFTQPFFLQLRSLPVPNIKPSKPAVTINPKYLSTTSCVNMLPTSTSTPPPDRDLTAKERRTLAKLERFLGENIPPELVFPTPTTTPTIPLKRSTSVLNSRSRGKASHKQLRSLVGISTPKTSTPSSAVPGRAAAALTTPESQSTREPETRVEDQSARPRSLTTGLNPVRMATSSRGASLDGSPNPPLQEISVTVERITTPDEYFTKGGKDWSGEWNVKDMDHVANALRGLKAR